MIGRTPAHIAGAAGIAAQVAAAYYFVLVPALTVPPPQVYAFVLVWLLLVGRTITWWRHHPWRSLLVPVVSVPSVMLLLEVGRQLLGWVP
jgi:hypothetical protein